MINKEEWEVYEGLSKYEYLNKADKRHYAFFISAIHNFVPKDDVAFQEFTNQELRHRIDELDKVMGRMIAQQNNHEILEYFQELLVKGITSKIFEEALEPSAVAELLDAFCAISIMLGEFMLTSVEYNKNRGLKPLAHQLINREAAEQRIYEEELRRRVVILMDCLSNLELTKRLVSIKDYEAAKIVYEKALNELTSEII